MNKVIIGGVIAGVIAFVWVCISWMVLPWHMGAMKSFKSEMIAERMLGANAPEKGIYVLPYAHGEDKEAVKRAHEKMMKGPFAFAVVSPNGARPMPITMLIGFLTQLIAGFLITWLLLQTAIPTYMGRLAFVKIVAFTAGVLCYIPNWNWWGFPAYHTILGILDLTIAWGLAGLWLAAFTAKE